MLEQLVEVLSLVGGQVLQRLDLRSLRVAADALIGEHDFSSFCRRPKDRPDASLVRRVIDAAWHDLGDDLLRFDIVGASFCHQMVRSFVGTLVDIGMGKYPPDSIPEMLAAHDRTKAGRVAPPHGLTFWEVRY